MDISNKTLAILVILAIVVSLVGLFIGRARIVTIGQPTGTGNIDASVASNVDIDVEYGIDFAWGGGAKTAGMNYAETRRSDDAGLGDCGPSATDNCWVLVGSIGLTGVDISYLANKNLWYYTDDGVTRNQDRDHESVGFKIKIEESDTTANFATTNNAALCVTPIVTVNGNYDSCTGIIEGTYAAYTTADVDTTPPSEAGTLLIKDCYQCQGFRVGAEVKVPDSGEDSGARTTIVTFSAVET